MRDAAVMFAGIAALWGCVLVVLYLLYEGWPWTKDCAVVGHDWRRVTRDGYTLPDRDHGCFRCAVDTVEQESQRCRRCKVVLVWVEVEGSRMHFTDFSMPETMFRTLRKGGFAER